MQVPGRKHDQVAILVPDRNFAPLRAFKESAMTPVGFTRFVYPALRSLVAALLACVLSSAALLATPAGAAAAPTSASRFYINGAGFGHGVGMSQYGAAGFAQHGFTYQQILAHYYSATTLTKVNPNRSVTVLLHEGAATFRGALRVSGTAVRLSPRTNYGVIAVGPMLRIISHGRNIGTFHAPLTVTGGSTPLMLVGQGRYLGALVFRPASTGGVMTINAVGLDNYVRGVVAAEMPSSWPAQALEAQAVAARTYAITAGAVAADFDVYDDTRSQMYEGVDAQTPTSNAAVAATSGQVVEYNGEPAVTYFFASSGGYTESVQNVWYGIAPEAWLHGEPDPFDDSYNNPYYRWSEPYKVATVARKLRRFYSGTFEGLNITQTGVSPRVVRAQVVGSQGSGTVTGVQLQQLFGTLSTYMSFSTLTETGSRSGTPVQAASGASTTATPTQTPATTTTTTTPPPPGGSGLAGAISPPASAAASAAPVTPLATADTRSALSVRGSVYPAQRGATVVAQLDQAGRWMRVASARVAATGKYRIPVPSAGTYRVAYGAVNGPSIAVP
jgi:stage II sporulation protein D